VPEREIASILDAARTWIDRCLIEDRAIFGSAQRWTASTVTEVHTAFVDNPDAGEDSFLVKLRGQLKDITPEARALAAEMLWALLLFPSNMSPGKKREQLEVMLDDANIDHTAAAPFLTDEVMQGVGSAGTGFHAHRWRELRFLLNLTANLKQESTEDRRRILTDYDRFCEWIETVPEDGQRQFRQMLRYFAFPDRVERMSSNSDRRKMLDRFQVASKKETRHWSERQLDDALLALRRRLESEHPGQILDFYKPPLKPDVRDDALVLIGTWKELDDREYQRVQQWLKEHGAWAIWWSFPIRDNAQKDLEGRPFHLYVNTGGNRITHRLAAEEFETLPGTDGFETPWPDITFPEYRNVKRNGSSQSETFKSWLKITAIEALPTTLTTDDFEPAAGTKREGLLNQSAFGYATLKEPSGKPPALPPTPMQAATNLILYGPPGTGKTHWMQQKFADYTESLNATRPIQRYRVVTFHPSYSYEDFVRGIRPVAQRDGTTRFQLVDGVFKQLCDAARRDSAHRWALFIDEINRANIAKVFGELITLVEPNKRASYDAEGRLVKGLEVHLPGSVDSDVTDPPFAVPANLDLYGTMNTADRSIALLDIALRRRFEFREMEPEYELMPTIGAVNLGLLLRRINDRLEYLLDREHRVGHAYLMHARTTDDLRSAFHTQLIPLLQEYFFDDLSRVSLVLQTSAKPAFIVKEELVPGLLFSGQEFEPGRDARLRYLLTEAGSWTEASFVGIYSEVPAANERT
jgi:5-methylcytosine-specific restriction enzyme B